MRATIRYSRAQRFELCNQLGLAPPKTRPTKKPRVLPTNANKPVEHPCRFDFVAHVKTENKSNLSLGFSKQAAFAEMGRRRKLRAAMFDACILAGVPNLLAYQTAQVTMRRGSFGRGLDSDGLATALKQCRDAIADALGFKDDSNSRLTWRVENVKADRKQSWVAVEIVIDCLPETGLLATAAGVAIEVIA